MNDRHPDRMTLDDLWSDLSGDPDRPVIDPDRLNAYRLGRIGRMLAKHDAAMCLLVNPISLRYAVDCRSYSLFNAHIPTTYLFASREGPTVLHGAYDPTATADIVRPGRALSFFDGATELPEASKQLADDVVAYLREIGTDNRRVAVEYVNPSLTQALMRRGLEVLDGVMVSEAARTIKSEDEIACIRWAIKVAEFGIGKVRDAIRPGVSEVRLWALMNYANLANNGDWHDGRMLASGPRTNPWCQEASERRVEPGDLVGIDTDMIGPFGYFADISRTFHCGPGTPARRQKQLYRLAVEEIDFNMTRVRPGMTLSDLQRQAWPTPEEFRQNAYSCVIHGAGMCDEFPRVTPIHRGPTSYEGVLEPGMVICVESYMGAVGERDGVKLEQQVLVTEDGCEPLSRFPFEDSLLE